MAQRTRAGTRADIPGFLPFVFPHYYILQTVCRDGLFLGKPPNESRNNYMIIRYRTTNAPRSTSGRILCSNLREAPEQPRSARKRHKHRVATIGTP